MKKPSLLLVLSLVLLLDLNAFGIAGEHAFERAARLRDGADFAFATGRPVLGFSRLRRARRAERRGFRRAVRFQCGVFGRFCF